MGGPDVCEVYGKALSSRDLRGGWASMVRRGQDAENQCQLRVWMHGHKVLMTGEPQGRLGPHCHPLLVLVTQPVCSRVYTSGKTRQEGLRADRSCPRGEATSLHVKSIISARSLPVGVDPCLFQHPGRRQLEVFGHILMDSSALQSANSPPPKLRDGCGGPPKPVACWFPPAINIIYN